MIPDQSRHRLYKRGRWEVAVLSNPTYGVCIVRLDDGRIMGFKTAVPTDDADPSAHARKAARAAISEARSVAVDMFIEATGMRR